MRSATPSFVAMILLGLLLVLTAALGAATVFSFLQPAERLTNAGPSYEHSSTFDYTVRVEPSTLYPRDVIGPGEAIYTRLARSLDLGFNYSLKTDLPTDGISGDYATSLQIATPQGWSKTIDLIPPTIFVGPTFSFRTSLELAPLLALIEAIEKETGYIPGTYDLSIVPSVHLRGRIGSEPVEDTFNPSFDMKLGRIQLVPDAKLAQSQAPPKDKAVTLTQQFSILGIRIPVAAVRWLSAAGLSLSIAATAILAAAIFLGMGKRGKERIQARYGSMLVSVAQADLKGEAQRIQVASMSDLARIAQQDGGMILYQQVAPQSHRYFVQNGTVIYEYMLVDGAAEKTKDA